MGLVKASRRDFLLRSSVASVGILLLPDLSLGEQQAKEKPSALKPEMVKDFVVKGHGDFAGVKTLLEEEPGILNACWDWGGGDFETAMEGAGHIGNREIATYLISKGARMNIFTAVMLGKLEIVKAILTVFPDIVHSKGPHGLTFLHHARKGGEEALPVLEYLQSLGAS